MPDLVEDEYDFVKNYYLMAIENGDHIMMNNLANMYKRQNKNDLAKMYQK